MRSNSIGIAVALIVVGVATSPALAAIFPDVRLPLAGAIAMSIVAAGLALAVATTHGNQRRSAATLTVAMRQVTARVEQCAAHADRTGEDVGTVATTLDNERRNLGMVAAGLGEMRQIVQHERRNLGVIATDLDEIRRAMQTFHAALEQVRSEAAGMSSRLDGVAGHADLVAQRLDDLRSTVVVERRNLGMIAGALNDVRRLTAGVHLFDARQAAFEDSLIAIAERIDRFDDGLRATDPPASVAEPPPASARDIADGIDG